MSEHYVQSHRRSRDVVLREVQNWLRGRAFDHPSEEGNKALSEFGVFIEKAIKDNQEQMKTYGGAALPRSAEEVAREWKRDGHLVRHIASISQQPVQPGRGSRNCYACDKVWRHHNRGEVGTVCLKHDHGPACHVMLTPPGADPLHRTLTIPLPLLVPMRGKHSRETRNGQHLGWSLVRMGRGSFGRVVARVFFYGDRS